jgi:hypothetical protein
MGRLPLSAAMLFLAALMAPNVWSQEPARQRADTAWVREDWVAARQWYAEVLRANPEDSRAVYRLARLTSNRDSALTLYRQYTELEPTDPWGWMAFGEALMEADDARAASRAYDEAERLAPAEPEVISGRAGFEARLGRYWLRAGRPRRAAESFARSLAVEPSPAVEQRLQQARALNAPALEPAAGYQRDSDGNRTSRVSLLADLAVGDGVRLGFSAAHSTIADDFEQYPEYDGSIRLVTKPGLTTRLDLRAGLAHLDPAPAGESWTPMTGQARFRWTGKRRGPVVALTGQRNPVGSTPQSVLNQAVRTEGHLLAELPLGPIRLRGEGRAGSIETVGQSNGRWGIDGALVVPLDWRGEVSLQAHRLSYQDSTSAGYFAPQKTQTLEVGSYVELGDAAPWLVALDLGIGAQRIQRFGAAPGEWSLAARLWGWIAYSLGNARALQLEIEGYNAPGTATAIATSPDWRQGSAALSLRWGL